MSKAALWATRGRPSANARISGSRVENLGSSATISGVMPWSEMLNGSKSS